MSKDIHKITLQKTKRILQIDQLQPDGSLKRYQRILYTDSGMIIKGRWAVGINYLVPVKEKPPKRLTLLVYDLPSDKGVPITLKRTKQSEPVIVLDKEKPLGGTVVLFTDSGKVDMRTWNFALYRFTPEDKEIPEEIQLQYELKKRIL